MPEHRSNMSSVQRRDVAVLARGGIVNLSGSASQAVFAFALLFVVGRGMGAGGAGAFLESVALFNILATTATLGVSTGFVYSVSRLRAANRESDLGRMYIVGYAPLIILSCLAAAIVYLTADQLARTLGDAQHSDQIGAYLRTMAWFIPPASAFLATLGATRGYELMWPTVLLEKNVKLGLQVGFTFVALALGLSHEAVALGWLLPILIATAIALVWLRKLHLREPESTNRPQTSYRRLFRDFWAFTLPRSFASIFRTAVLWLDVLLVGALLSPEAAGIYAVATRLLQFGLAVAMAVGQVSQPMISRLIARGETTETRGLYEIATSWQMLLTWPQYIAIALFAVPILSLFGSEFAGGAPVVVVLAASAIIGSAAGPVDMVLLMAGKSMWSFWNTALSLAINLTLNLILIPRIGIFGAAIAWAAARIIGNVVPLVQVALSLKLHPFGRKWSTAAGLSFIVFVGLGVIFRAVAPVSLTTTFVYIGVAVLVYGIAILTQRDMLELSVAGAALGQRFSRRRVRATEPPSAPSVGRQRS